MSNFGEIKIEKNIPTGGVEDAMKGDKNNESVGKYSHIGADEINNWRDEYDGNVFFGALKKSVTGLRDRLVDVQKWHNNRDKNLGNKFKNDDPENPGRRKILKWAALATTVAATDALIPRELSLGEDKKLAEEKALATEKKLQEIREAIHQDEQENIRIENAIALREVLGGQYLKNGRIEIDKETMKDIRYYWVKEYQKGGRQHLGLISSLERMEPWYNEIKETFINNLPGINEEAVNELVYLAIPESHFKIGAKSKAGAKGEYQMMARTARGEGALIVDNKVDERLDILANAEGAAKTLFNYYKIAKNDKNSSKDAWDLALAKFNGGYIKEYFKTNDGLQSEVRYENYLKFRQDRLNNFFRQVEQEGSMTRDIRSKESLKDIAKRYGVVQDKLKFTTKGESKKRAVVIPIKINKNGRIDNKALDVIFDDYLSDSLENLNYPEKFYAVIKILKKEGLLLSENSDTEQIKFMTIGELKSSWAYWRKHKAKNMTLTKVNKFIHPPGTEASLQKLREGNPHIKGDNVDLSSSKYHNVKVYFLENSVLDTQFREFPTIHSKQRKTIKHPKK